MRAPLAWQNCSLELYCNCRNCNITWEWKFGPSAQASFCDCVSVFQAWRAFVNHKGALVCNWFSRGSTMVTVGIRRDSLVAALWASTTSQGTFARLHKRWLHSPSACLYILQWIILGPCLSIIYKKTFTNSLKFAMLLEWPGYFYHLVLHPSLTLFNPHLDWSSSAQTIPARCAQLKQPIRGSSWRDLDDFNLTSSSVAKVQWHKDTVPPAKHRDKS